MRAWGLGLLVAGVLVACSGDDPAPAVAASPGPVAEAFANLEEAAAAIGCDAYRDVGTGGNAGLEQFGVCNIGSANIDIYLTSQRNLWESLADQFPTVLGPNWVIVSPSTAEGARLIHERVGGELVIPPSPTPT